MTDSELKLFGYGVGEQLIHVGIGNIDYYLSKQTIRLLSCQME